MPIVKCARCTKEFNAKPSWIKNGWGKYCSQKCNHDNQKKGTIIACFICGKDSYKSAKDQTRSKSGNFFCSKTCQTVWRNKYFSGSRHPNWTHRTSSYRNLLLRSDKQKICLRCNGDDYRVLAVHHKDKNRKNNDVSNLIWLCHNCHYLIHHYKNESNEFMVPVA